MIQMCFSGHVLQKNCLENLALIEQLEGKKEHRKKQWINSLAAWMKKGKQNTELINMTSSKDLRQSIITKVSWYGTMMMMICLSKLSIFDK